ncbi:MAG: MFS transporter [Acidimicrobiia bacterium]|nr:MFS transporter [Acidimicrobiia bacterium]
MTRAITAPHQPRIFRGWWVLVGIFVTMTTGSGFAFYAQGVFLDALVDEQGFSVGTAGAGTGLFFVISGIAGYFAGGLISRFDIRAVMTVGATIAAVGILLLGQVRTVWQMFAVFVIYGGGYALAGLVPATSLVTRWFHVRRSIALSIASTGLSVGGIVITPVIAQLIDDESLVALAPRLAVGFWLGIVPITLLLLRPSPEALGLRPDGAPPLDTGPDRAEVPGVPFAAAVRTRYFRFMSGAFILVMGAQVGALQHVFKLTKDAVDVDAASLALIVVTSTSVGARLLGGIAATRIPLATLTTTLIGVQALGITIIGLADQQWTILLGVVILGLAMGNLLMLHPLLLADAFGVRDYPRIYGLGSLLMVTGVGLGPFVVGVVRDGANYRTAFLAMTAVALVGLVIFRLAGRPVSDGDAAVAPAAAAALAD